jgi:hypothetical protein
MGGYTCKGAELCEVDWLVKVLSTILCGTSCLNAKLPAHVWSSVWIVMLLCVESPGGRWGTHV